MDKMLSRRSFLKGLAAGGVAITLVGCGGGAPAPTQAPAKPAEPTKAPAAGAATSAPAAPVATKAASAFNWKKYDGAKIRFVNNTHDWSTELVPKALPEFEKLTGIKVQWEVLPENQFRQKLTLELTSNPEAVDGYMSLPSWDGKAFTKSGWYEPVKKYLDNPELTAPDFDFKDFFPSCVDIATVESTLVGVPLYPEVQVLYYNKDAFAAKGLKVPTTMDEFVAAAEKLYDKNANMAGYVSRGDGTQAVYTVAPFIYSMGGRWLDDKGRPEFNSDGSVKGLEVYGSTLAKYGPPGIAGQQWAQNQVVFGQGQAAMTTDSSNFVSTYEDPKKSKLAGGKVGYAPLPKGPAGIKSTLISWILAMSPKGKNKEATWLFIQWLTGKDMVKRHTQYKLPVGRQSVWDSAEYKATVPKEWMDVWTVELPTAAVNQANPLVAQVPETRDAIGKAIVEVIQGGSAKAAADKGQAELLKILGMN